MPPTEEPKTNAEVPSNTHHTDRLSTLPLELWHLIYRQLAGESGLIKVSSHRELLPYPYGYEAARRHGTQLVQQHLALLIFFNGDTLQPDDVPVDSVLSLPDLYEGIGVLSHTSRQHPQDVSSYLSMNRNVVIFSTAHELHNIRTSAMATFTLNVVKEVTFVVMVKKGNRQHPALEALWSHDLMCHYAVEEEDVNSGFEFVEPEPIRIQARMPLPSNELVDMFDFVGDEPEVKPRYLAESGGTWDGEECIREIQAHGANPRAISVLYSELSNRGPPGYGVEAFPKVDHEGLLPSNHSLLKMARAIRVAKDTNPSWHSELQQLCVKVCVKEYDEYVASGPRPYLGQISAIAGVPAIEQRTIAVSGARWRYKPAVVTKWDTAQRM
ncbi:hypothetical protein LRP88_07378 [Fusarium phalaenopsidis]